ncbi:BspA family leucine-rich repeat surface protein, partial [Jejuia spongiicola]
IEASNVSGDVTSTTLTAGTYIVAIRGAFPRIYFNNTGDKDKIQTIEQWGASVWISMESAFYGCSNLILNATDTPNLSQTISMQSMFLGCSSFVDNGGVINNWEVSNVTNMEEMFNGATSFNQSLGSWDISKVTNMADLFTGVTLSTTNYDATLIGWHTDSSGVANDGIDDVPNNITLHGGNSQYCTAETAWNSLDTSFNWTITDDGPGCTAEDYFITTWVVEENETITIPTTGTGYSYDVDWSYDGITFNPESTNVSEDATSTTLTAGTYIVAIRGAFPRIYFNNTGDKDKIQTIEQWGANPWIS